MLLIQCKGFNAATVATLVISLLKIIGMAVERGWLICTEHVTLLLTAAGLFD